MGSSHAGGGLGGGEGVLGMNKEAISWRRGRTREDLQEAACESRDEQGGLGGKGSGIITGAARQGCGTKTPDYGRGSSIVFCEARKPLEELCYCYRHTSP